MEEHEEPKHKKERNPQKKNQEKQRRRMDQVKKMKKNGNWVLNAQFPRGFFSTLAYLHMQLES